MKTKIQFLKLSLVAFFVLVLSTNLSFGQANHLVISQVYGGGGNGGSYWKQDFIELYNGTSDTIFLTGWSVQYTSATGTSWTNKTDLSGFVAPGRYFLIQESQGAGGTANLPTPDILPASPIAMGGTAGKVALCNSTTFLTGACPTGGSIIDFVGYGPTANCSETSPAPLLSNTTAAIRANGGCTDNNNNSTDFSAVTPNPRNSSTLAWFCSVKKLLISSVTPSTPYVNEPIDIIVESVDASDIRVDVHYATIISLSSNGNAGPIGGTIIDTIPAGSDSITVSGITFSSTGTGVTIIATPVSGDYLTVDSSDLFDVIPITTPSVSTNVAFDIASDSAVSGGEVFSEGGDPVIAKGVVFDISSSPVTNPTTDGTGLGVYSSVLKPLLENTTYFYRSYATNGVGTAYGGEFSFITLLSVGTGEKNPQNKITVFNNNINLVILFNLIEASDSRVQIFDISGRLVYNTSVAKAFQNKMEVNTHGWSKGIYMIHISSGTDDFSCKINL